MDIRKIAIGPDYKNGAMHYIVGQKVLSNSSEIHCIRQDKKTKSIKIFVINEKEEVLLWKEFNHSVPCSIEFNIDF
jgi:hypothetical protein